MRKYKLFTVPVIAAVLFASCTKTEQQQTNDYPIHAVAFTDVKFTDDFWAPRIRTNQEVTIPIALHQCEITGRIDNFRKAAGLMEGEFNTEFPFDDTDIYKILEGASYSIQMFPNPALEAQMDSLIHLIELAQEDDGYLYTPRTAGKPGHYHPWVGENRWEKTSDLSHELYNCGHLYEAAVAHYQATGKRSLLDVATRSADLLVRDFGSGKLTYEPGHQIVEMGLVKMYRATGKQEYLDLAKFFLDLKGNGERGAYCQSHKPVVEQDEAVGHAVRAVYMYSGMADVAALTGDMQYQTAIDNIWDNVVSKKYYITGGIGARHEGEAFGDNYELPNHSAYCETCAAIGNVYWNHRMFLTHGQSKYYDVLERTLYNGLISGISLSGDHFFYPNPLEADGNYGRSEWFGCACCPSNLSRFMASIPGYSYAQKDNNIYVNLYVDSRTNILLGDDAVSITQRTDYPWKGEVSINVQPQRARRFALKLRAPGWAQGKPVPSDLYAYTGNNVSTLSVKINGQETPVTIGADGYLTIDRKWNTDDHVTLTLPMDIQRVTTNTLVQSNHNRVAIERGPLVYCLEGIDNKQVLDASLANNTLLTPQWEPDMLGGVVTINGNGSKLIPYYAWNNRGNSPMQVWISESEQAGK